MIVTPIGISLALVLAFVVPSDALAKPKPPPPPPDTAADCTLSVAAPDTGGYLVLTIVGEVRCATTKRRIDVVGHLTRDGILISPVLPAGSETRTCANASVCNIVYDIFSLDNHPRPGSGRPALLRHHTGRRRGNRARACVRLRRGAASLSP